MVMRAENWVGEYTPTVGGGDITLGGPIDGFCGFANAGDNVDVYYTIMDGANKETGIGTVVSGNLIRKTIHAVLLDGSYTKGGSPLQLSGDAQVYLTANASFMDHIQKLDADLAQTIAQVTMLSQVTINGHPMSGYISLSASDVHARHETWTPNASDVGSYSKSESDQRYVAADNIETSEQPGKIMIVGGPRDKQLTADIQNVSVVLRGELASDSGASLVRYKTPVSTGVNRAIEDKLYEIITVTDFNGVVGDGITDCADGLDRVVEHVKTLSSMSMFQRKTKIRFPSGHYKTSRPFILWDGVSMSGDSQSSTCLEMTSSTATTGVTGTTPARGLPRDVNCCVAVFSSVAGYPYRTAISDIQIFGIPGNVTTTSGKVESAIYAPEAAFLTIDRVRTWYTNHGILSYNLWMASFRDLDLREHGTRAFSLIDDGTGRGGSTSCGFDRVYAHSCSGGFWLYGLNYSTMNSCGADEIGKGLAVNRSESPYVFQSCQGLVCNAPGVEAVYTRRAFFVIGGDVTINNANIAGLKQAVTGESIYIVNVTSNGNLVLNGGQVSGVEFDKTLASECYAVAQTAGTDGSVISINSKITEKTTDVNGAAIGNVMYGTRMWRGKVTHVDGFNLNVQSSTKTVITTGTTDSLINSGLDSTKYVVTDAVAQLNKSGPTAAEAAYKIQVTGVSLTSARIYISNHDGTAYFGTLPIRVTFIYTKI